MCLEGGPDTRPRSRSERAGRRRLLSDGDVWAVGSVGGFAHEKTLVEHFNGSGWSKVKSPNPRELSTDGNVLNAIDARTTTDIWAVGTHFLNGQSGSRPLVLHFDGDRWRVTPNPPGALDDGYLRGVAAVSANDAWAVGARFIGGPGERDPLILHWNGSTWKIADAPNPDGVEADSLTAVTAVSADDVWAVGSVSGTYGSITLHWDGSAWAVVANQHVPQFDGLSAVAARSAKDIGAVGQNRTPSQGHLTFGEHFNGSDPDPQVALGADG